MADWTQGLRESNRQPAELPVWAPGSSTLYFISLPSLQHLASHHKVIRCTLCLHREPRPRLRRGEGLRGGSTCQTSHRQKKTHRGKIFPAVSFYVVTIKHQNHNFHNLVSRRMSGRRLLSMRWHWEDETLKCNWKRISELLLPWSRFLVNDNECTLVIEPTFKVFSKILISRWVGIRGMNRSSVAGLLYFDAGDEVDVFTKIKLPGFTSLFCVVGMFDRRRFPVIIHLLH